MEERELVTISVAARKLGISASTLRRWEKSGKIPPPTRTLGGDRRYVVAELQQVATQAGSENETRTAP